MVQEVLCDILQSVFEEAFGSSAMMQNIYLLDVFVNIDRDSREMPKKFSTFLTN